LCTGHRGDRLNSPIHGIPPPLAHPSPPLHPTIPVIAFSPHQSTQGAVIFALGSEHKTPWLCPPSLWLLTLAVWVFLLCTDRFSFLFAMDFRPGFHLTKSPFFNCPAPKRHHRMFLVFLETGSFHRTRWLPCANRQDAQLMLIFCVSSSLQLCTKSTSETLVNNILGLVLPMRHCKVLFVLEPTVWALIAPCLAFPHFFSAETPAIFGRYLRCLQFAPLLISTL